MFITALQYLKMGINKIKPHEKSLNKAYGIVFLCVSIQLLLIVLYLISLEKSFVDHSYMGNFDNLSLTSYWLYESAWILWYVLYGIFIYAFEKIRQKRKPLGPIIFILLFIIVRIILVPYGEIGNNFRALTIMITGLYYTHVLFLLMKWSKKDLKAATSFIILGSILIFTGMTFLTPQMMHSGLVPSLFIPSLYIIGTILCMAPTFVKPEFFLRSTYYWFFFSVSVIGMWVIQLIFYIFFRPELVILFVLILLFYSIECGLLVRETVLKKGGDKLNKKIDVLGIFTQPEKVTEEEVSISKEKKICLVCKGKVGGNIFMCPECESFYCLKCSEAIIGIENACWACDTPIDPSKPVVKPEKKDSKSVAKTSKKTENIPKKAP